MALSRDRLGEPVRIFDGRAANRRAWAWLVLLGAAALALVPAAIVYLHERVWWAGVPALLLSMGYAGAVGWIAGRDRPRVRGRVARLYTGGLAVGGEAGHRWDEIVSVTVAGVPGGPGARIRWCFTIVADDGSVLRLGDDIPDVRSLGVAVAHEVTARVVPRRFAAVKAGETVRMGPYTVDLDGVEKDGERLPWDAVQDVVIENGLVAVHARPGRTDLTTVASQMPDALAFTVVCHQVRDLAESS
ncbi:hypothetical protein E1293_41385 [Actinomadura darangshiensis]|uniref:Uncharacterized protein n=1 Tax=Actinomadura darangshiensis TaxID=705336 RepID=A0A4R4ZZ04_9ACTN|nr:DUF6585 family protein [Actinomadura darangshiensis]TDD64531.1 hypothetical protein E1293_41385 [Actinomadura darangshiensis]